MKPLLNPQTEKQIAQFLNQPIHALLIVGEEGAGKRTVAQYVATQLLQTDLTPHNHPYILSIAPTEGSISVASVREIRTFLQLKVPTKSAPKKTITRVVIISDADAMTTEAQNALLKSLEEPPADTVFILTAKSEHGLLQTVQSRTRKLVLHPIEQDVLAGHFARLGHSQTEITKAFLLSNGLPGLMTDLLGGKEVHPLTEAIATAKSFLSASKFERLASIEVIGKQRETVTVFLTGLQKVAQAALHNPSAMNDTKKVKQWHSVSKYIVEAQKQIDQNASPKLVVTNLALHI